MYNSVLLDPYIIYSCILLVCLIISRTFWTLTSTMLDLFLFTYSFSDGLYI